MRSSDSPLGGRGRIRRRGGRSLNFPYFKKPLAVFVPSFSLSSSLLLPSQPPTLKEERRGGSAAIGARRGKGRRCWAILSLSLSLSPLPFPPPPPQPHLAPREKEKEEEEEVHRVKRAKGLQKREGEREKETLETRDIHGGGGVKSGRPLVIRH